MSNVAKIAHISLLNARNCLEEHNYGRAFANFLLFLKLKSESCADNVYTEFALATREWCNQLEGQNRLEDLFKCYDQACELFPDHEVVLNNIGAQLFRLGYVEEAAAYIRKSLLVNPSYLAARDNLENVCSHLVERWHFSMLNDKRRNVAFKFAIDKAVKSGYTTVLDIGTGTGILSMMCEFSGADKVTACDGSRAMVDVARDVLLANGVFNKINLLHKLSTEIQVPRDISSRVKLIVTETFDAGLFGEHIVSTLIHAWNNLISTSPMGTVIPCAATMYVCGIECETIRTQSRLLYPVLQSIDVSHVDLLCNTSHIAEEPYTTENLAKIRGGYKILTNIVELLRVSFCNLCELESLYKGKDWLCDLYVKQHGRLDALAVWFDLHLDDTITIGTGADKTSCWEQAIYPTTSVLRQQSNSHENCHIKKKEKLRCTFHFEHDCLRLAKCEVRNEQLKKGVLTTSLISTVQAGSAKPDVLVPASSGTSVKECHANSLPFRKRKVSSESDIHTCSCESSVNSGANHTGCRLSVADHPDHLTAVVDKVCSETVQSDITTIVTGMMETDVEPGQSAESRPHMETGAVCFTSDDENVSSMDLDIKLGKSAETRSHVETSTEYCMSKNEISTMDTDIRLGKSAEARLLVETSAVCFTLDSENVTGKREIDIELSTDLTMSDVEKGNSEYVTGKREIDIELSRDLTMSDVETGNSEHVTGVANLDTEMHIVMEKCTIDKAVTQSDTEVTASGSNRYMTMTANVENSVPCLETLPERTHICDTSETWSNLFPKLTLYAEQVDIEYINDIQLNRHYCQVIETFRLENSGRYLSLLYVTPRLSFLGIQAAKLGYDMVTMATPEDHHDTLHQVAALNGCKQGEVILTELSDLNDLDMKVDVMVFDVVEPCGALRQQVLEDLVYHRVTSSNSAGLILPADIKVHGLFIESEELENTSHVTGNDKTLGFQIAEFINVFQMQNHMNIDMATLAYTKLTDVQELLHLDLNGISMETTANGLDKTVEKSIEVIASGKVTALVYWFELRLNKDTIISTLDSRCHWKQAGIILKNDITVVTEQHLVTKVTLQNSCLDVTILQPLGVNGHA